MPYPSCFPHMVSHPAADLTEVCWWLQVSAHRIPVTMGLRDDSLVWTDHQVQTSSLCVPHKVFLGDSRNTEQIPVPVDLRDGSLVGWVPVYRLSVPVSLTRAPRWLWVIGCWLPGPADSEMIPRCQKILNYDIYQNFSEIIIEMGIHGKWKQKQA